MKQSAPPRRGPGCFRPPSNHFSGIYSNRYRLFGNGRGRSGSRSPTAASRPADVGAIDFDPHHECQELFDAERAASRSSRCGVTSSGEYCPSSKSTAVTSSASRPMRSRCCRQIAMDRACRSTLNVSKPKRSSRDRSHGGRPVNSPHLIHAPKHCSTSVRTRAPPASCPVSRRARR